jgi:uncharacterized oligopeptide transporter (OPT) family protein
MTHPFAEVLLGGRHLVIKWRLRMAAFVLVVLGVGFLAVAVDLWLTEQMGAPAAAAVTGGLLVLTGLAVVGVAAIVTTLAPSAASPERGLEAADIADLAATLIRFSQKLDVEARSSVKPLTIAALVIGCAVGYSPALQRLLKGLFR